MHIYFSHVIQKDSRSSVFFVAWAYSLQNCFRCKEFLRKSYFYLTVDLTGPKSLIIKIKDHSKINVEKVTGKKIEIDSRNVSVRLENFFLFSSVLEVFDSLEFHVQTFPPEVQTLFFPSELISPSVLAPFPQYLLFPRRRRSPTYLDHGVLFFPTFWAALSWQGELASDLEGNSEPVWTVLTFFSFCFLLFIFPSPTFKVCPRLLNANDSLFESLDNSETKATHLLHESYSQTFFEVPKSQ